MTDEQINKLKTLLESSSQKQANPELDQEILQQAKLQSELNQNQHSKASSESGWSFSNAAIAFSALAFTTAILFSMAEMTSVKESDYAAEDTFEITESAPELATTDKPEATIKPSFVEPAAPPEKTNQSSIFDQEILAEIELPSAGQLVDGMHFSISEDRQHSEQVINQALADINQSLNAGNLATARKRYQQLREGCVVCTLPQTLEALAKINSNYSGSG